MSCCHCVPTAAPPPAPLKPSAHWSKLIWHGWTNYFSVCFNCKQNDSWCHPSINYYFFIILQVSFWHKPDGELYLTWIFHISRVLSEYLAHKLKSSTNICFILYGSIEIFLWEQAFFRRWPVAKKLVQWHAPLTSQLMYSYLSNKRTCPLILFKKKIQPTLWFSCNRLKIPPYPLVLRVGWIFYPTRLL